MLALRRVTRSQPAPSKPEAKKAEVEAARKVAEEAAKKAAEEEAKAEEVRLQHRVLAALVKNWQQEVRFEHCTPDLSGKLMCHGLRIPAPIFMTVPAAARPDGFGIAGSVLLTLGCKLFSRLSGPTQASNSSTTDLTQVFTVKPRGKAKAGSKGSTGSDVKTAESKELPRVPSRQYKEERRAFLRSLYYYCSGRR